MAGGDIAEPAWHLLASLRQHLLQGPVSERRQCNTAVYCKPASLPAIKTKRFVCRRVKQGTSNAHLLLLLLLQEQQRLSWMQLACDACCAMTVTGVRSANAGEFKSSQVIGR